MGDTIKQLTDGLTGQSASEDAAKEMQYGSQRAQGAMMTAYNNQKADLNPYQTAGTSALTQLQDPNFMKDFTGDPGYQFRLQQGMNAINNAASARGMANSGQTMKALSDYGQNTASNEYNNAYNRSYQRLSGLAGMGQNATNQAVNVEGNYGSGMAGLQNQYANSMASNDIAQGNRMSSLWNQGIGLGAMGAMGAFSGAGKLFSGGGGGGNNGGYALGEQPTGVNGTPAWFSDSTLKTNVRKVSQEEMDEMKSYLKAYRYNYISHEFGEGDWIGVMAQDLEKSKLGRTLVSENDKGQKQVDLKKVMSLFVATLAEG